MSKYGGVRYWSESRGDYVDIESMAGPHLVRAYRKLKDAGPPEDMDAEDYAKLIDAMEQEMKERSLDPVYKDGVAPEATA